MLLLFEAPSERGRITAEIDDLEIVNGLRRAIELKIASPYVILQFISRIVTRKIYQIYVVIRKGKIMHSSHVIGKGWRFPFMSRDDITIGPCQTEPESRNLGIFTSVLQRILSDYSGHRAWIFCDENNLASRCAIEKNEFKLIAKGRRTKPFGCHLIGQFIFKE